MESETKKVVKIVVVSFIVLFAIITIFNSFKTIPTGYVGVKTQFGKVQEGMLNEGINFKVPYIEKIVLMDCKIQKCEYPMEAASKDLQTVSLKLAVNYNVNKEVANQLYKEVGADYQSVILEPAIYEAVKYGVSNYTAEEMITMRGTVSDTIHKILETKVKDRGITIQNISILDMDFSAEYNAAIEKKQVVEQEVKAAQLELEKAKIENEKKIENAKAEAEVMRQQNTEITDKTLQLKELEVQQSLINKWNGQLPTTVSGDDALGVFNLNK